MLETRVITKVEASGRRENWQKKTHAYFLTPFLPAAFTLFAKCTTEFQNSSFWNVIFAVLTLSISNVKEIWKHLCLHFYLSVIQSIKHLHEIVAGCHSHGSSHIFKEAAPVAFSFLICSSSKFSIKPLP